MRRAFTGAGVTERLAVGALVVCNLAFVAHFLVVSLGRMTYPFELERHASIRRFLDLHCVGDIVLQLLGQRAQPPG
jgi:hypothetical protein